MYLSPTYIFVLSSPFWPVLRASFSSFPNPICSNLNYPLLRMVVSIYQQRSLRSAMSSCIYESTLKPKSTKNLCALTSCF